MADFKIDPDYKEVAERIDDLYEKYPNAVLEGDYISVGFGATAYIVYTAKCWREPTDPRPCIGIAMEEIPGKTPYTKGSEIQNAETSAWGRAIVAAGASRSKKIASADEVRSADARREADEADNKPAPKEHVDAFTSVMNAIADPTRRAEVKKKFTTRFGIPAQLKMGQLDAATAFVHEWIPETVPGDAGGGTSATTTETPAPQEPGSPTGENDHVPPAETQRRTEAAELISAARKRDPESVSAWLAEKGIPTDSRRWTDVQIGLIFDWIHTEPEQR